MTSSGCRTRARAIAMRWRCPPENSWGYRCLASGSRPTSCKARMTRASCWSWLSVVNRQAFADNFGNGHARAQAAERVLEHNLDTLAPGPEGFLGEVADVGATQLDVAGCAGKL